MKYLLVFALLCAFGACAGGGGGGGDGSAGKTYAFEGIYILESGQWKILSI